MKLRVPDIPVEDIDEKMTNPLSIKHPSRVLMIGRSRSGKTQATYGLVTDHFPHDRLYVYAKFINTPIYKKWRQEVEEIENRVGKKSSLWCDNMDDENWVPPNKIKGKKRNLYLTDDMSCEDMDIKKKIAELFIAGRNASGGATVINIMHSFKNGLPTNGRSSVTHLGLFAGIRNSDLSEIYSTYPDIQGTLSFKEFQKLYQDCVRIPYGFLWIDFDAKSRPYAMYRFKFDSLFNPRKIGEVMRDFDEIPPEFELVEDIDDLPQMLEDLKSQNGERGRGLKGGGVARVAGGEEIQVSPKERFKLLLGQLDIGNDNPLIRKEALGLLMRFKREGMDPGVVNRLKAKILEDS